jgi:nitrate reductase gamma subunit
MDLAVHVVAYAAIVVFLVAVAARFHRIRSYPLNVRWEIYPVPHEGARSKHGGSRLEESDWWTKEHRPDRLNEVRHMLPEMLFIQALYEHNRKLWYRSFPFHFGLYLLTGFAALMLARALLVLTGADPGWIPAVVPAVMAGAGFVLTLLGALGLIVMRVTDDDMRPYSNVSHYFNLLFFVGALGLVALGWIASGWSLAPFEKLFVNLVTGSFSLEGVPVAFKIGVLLTALLVAYIPLTHMSHFFVKWFTWHEIRWDDEPNVKGGRIERLIENALARPVTWSAPHIGADGTKTWADVATAEVEQKDDTR